MAFENFNSPKPMKSFNAGEQGGANQGDGNNSGQGPNTQVPDVVAKRFNWGAFLLSWIWGIGNKAYITLLSFVAGFIPIVGGLVVLGMQIWFGIKGNEWAWQNKRFQSIEHFHENQKKWAIAGVILTVIVIVLIVLCGSLLFTSALTTPPAISEY